MHQVIRKVVYVFLLVAYGFGAMRGWADDPKEKELLAQARKRLEVNEVNKALQLAQEVLRLNSNNGLAYSIVGSCYFRQHRYDDAAPMFEKAAFLQPSNANAWGDLGVIRLLRYEDEGAERAFKKMIALKPDDVWRAHVFLASIHYARGDVVTAKQDLVNAITSAPPNMQQSDEITEVLARVDAELASLPKVKEAVTTHFIVRCPPEFSQPLVDALCREAEGVHEEIEERFQYAPPIKPVILLLTERKRLMQLTGIQLAAPAANQSSTNRIFLTFVFGRDDTSDILQWLRKEYAAFVIGQLSYEACPQWLNEALSLAIGYEKATRLPASLAYLRRWLQEGKKLPDTAEVNAFFQSVVVERKPPPTDKVYPQVLNGAAIAIGEYLTEKVGPSRLRQALREIGNGSGVKQALSSALGMSWEEFEAAWQKRAQEHYGSPKLTAGQHYAFACAYTRLDDFDVALKEIQQALALTPTVGKYHALLAVIYWLTGRKEKAIAVLNEALQRGINDPAEYRRILFVYINAGRLDEGLAVAQRAIKEGYANSEVYNLTAYIYLEKNQPRAALSLVEKAVELDPGDGLSQKLLLKAYVKSGFPDKAIALGEQLVALNPNLEAEVYYLLGIAYCDKGDTDRAKAALEKALALGYEEAKEALEALKK